MATKLNDDQIYQSPVIVDGLPKVPTGIPGLDAILNGGLPAGRTTLVSGGPGTGKSILGLEFLYRRAMVGDPGIYVTFEERAKDVRQNALTLGWDFEPLEQSGKLFILEARVDPESILSGAFNLKGLTAIIKGKAEDMGASLIVFDAIDVLLRLFDDHSRECNELYALREWLQNEKMTSVLTVKLSKTSSFASQYEFLDFMVDCVITLDQRVVEQITTRRLRIVKYRGSDYGRNEYPFLVTDHGYELLSVSTGSLRHVALGEKVSCGHTRLDNILDGGFRKASCVLIAGPAGTGKSTLAAVFSQAACKRGEKVLYINFEESQEAMVSSMLSPGIDLRPHLDSGNLKILTAMPEAMGIEEHLLRIFQASIAHQPDHIVVDSISSCTRLGSNQSPFQFVSRIVNHSKECGTTVILINQVEGFTDNQDVNGSGILSLADSVLTLRYIDVGGEVNRMLLVMKSRGSKHSNQYREFLITDDGIDITDVYVGEGGVLTGAARQEQEAKENSELLLRTQEIERKKKELAKLVATVKAEKAKGQAELTSAELEIEQLKLANEVLTIGQNKRGDMHGKDINSERFESRFCPTKKVDVGSKGDAE